MEGVLHQVLSGIANGGIYASVALALVMIYQATHHVNFAQGEMATLSTYIALTLINAGLPYWIAFVATVVVSFVIGVLIERILMRPMMDAPVLASVGVFIGLLLIINASTGWMFDYTIKTFPTPFPGGPMLFSGYVSGHELGATAVTLVVLIAVYLFFRHTKLGLAMRAAAFNPVSARLVGIRVGWMLALGWGLAAAIGAIAGMMVAPIVYLDPNMMGGILLYAFAGALLGGIDNPLGAVLGGFAVGVIENLAGAYLVGTVAQTDGRTDHHRRRAGGETVRPVRPHRAEPGVAAMDPQATTAAPNMMRTAAVAVLGWLVIALVPTFLFSNYHLFQLTMVVVYATAILGLAILTGFNGQISLGHGAFYAIGAYVTAILMYQYEVPYWATLPVSAIVCARVRVPDRIAGAAAGRPLPGADHLRACRRGAAAAEAQRAGAVDRWRAGARHRQAGPAVRYRYIAGPMALFVHSVRCRRCCSWSPGTSCGAVSGAP